MFDIGDFSAFVHTNKVTVLRQYSSILSMKIPILNTAVYRTGADFYTCNLCHIVSKHYIRLDMKLTMCIGASWPTSQEQKPRVLGHQDDLIISCNMI